MVLLLVIDRKSSHKWKQRIYREQVSYPKILNCKLKKSILSSWNFQKTQTLINSNLSSNHSFPANKTILFGIKKLLTFFIKFRVSSSSFFPAITIWTGFAEKYMNFHGIFMENYRGRKRVLRTFVGQCWDFFQVEKKKNEK